MGYGIRAFPEVLRELAASSLTNNYQAIGTPFGDSARVVSFANSTPLDIYVSLDGVNDHFRIAANGFFLLDVSANKVRDDGLFIAEGTQVWAKFVSSTTSTGDFWVTVIVGQGGK